MPISERVEATLKQKCDELINDERFVELLKFYQKMQEQGIALEQPYSLPPRDTIGKRRYQLKNQTK